MDIKYILSSVTTAAEKIGASGKLLAGVRLTGAVNGERGEGYWLLYEDNIVLLYRSLGKSAYEGCCGGLSDWSYTDYREEKYALSLKVKYIGTEYIFEFTPAERSSAEIVLEAISKAHASPRTLFAEELLVIAGLFSCLSSGEHEIFTAGFLGKDLQRAGRKYAAEYGLTKMLEKGNELFSEEQKKSVLANLIEMRMSDGLWQSEEDAALRELATVWNVPQDFFDTCAGILITRRRIWELFKN